MSKRQLVKLIPSAKEMSTAAAGFLSMPGYLTFFYLQCLPVLVYTLPSCTCQPGAVHGLVAKGATSLYAEKKCF